MKSIYLVRHSIAEPAFSKPDFEREITTEGYLVSARKLYKIRNVSFGDIFYFSQFADA